MIPLRPKKKPDPDQQRGVGRALHSAFDPSMDEEDRERFQRLIDQMKDFESNGGAK